jgi:hypothetical protein
MKVVGHHDTGVKAHLREVRGDLAPGPFDDLSGRTQADSVVH